MNSKESADIVEFLNAAFPRSQPLKGAAAQLMAASLMELDRGDAIRAIKSLHRVKSWMPSFAELLAECAPAEASSQAEFAAVWRACGLTMGQRAKFLSPRALATVERMGGWAEARDWNEKSKGFIKRDFERAYSEAGETREVIGELRPGELLAELRSGESEARDRNIRKVSDMLGSGS